MPPHDLLQFATTWRKYGGSRPWYKELWSSQPREYLAWDIFYNDVLPEIEGVLKIGEGDMPPRVTELVEWLPVECYKPKENEPYQVHYVECLLALCHRVFRLAHVTDIEHIPTEGVIRVQVLQNMEKHQFAKHKPKENTERKGADRIVPIFSPGAGKMAEEARHALLGHTFNLSTFVAISTCFKAWKSDEPPNDQEAMYLLDAIGFFDVNYDGGIDEEERVAMQKAMQAIGELVTDEQCAEMVEVCYSKIKENPVSSDGLRQIKALFEEEQQLRAKAEADGIDYDMMVAETKERVEREESSHTRINDLNAKGGLRPNKKRFLQQMNRAYNVARRTRSPASEPAE